MNLESSVTCVALASLALACSGSTQIGESHGNEGGSGGSVSSGGVGGSSNGGAGTTTTSGVGGSAGPSSAGGMPGSGGSGGTAGATSTGAGGVGGNAGCQSALDCPPPGAACELCADGSEECPEFECIEGECVQSFPTCQANCAEDADCPVSLAPCAICADGTSACPWAHCVNGSCQNGTEVCGDADPCQGKACGDDCSACEPDSPLCNNVRMYCNERLECQSNAPQCNALACETDDECPLIDACSPCADGTTCEELKCVNGTCEFRCPEDGVCSGDGDSCAGGASCCSGLTCCAGVPVPEGEEYCSASDCPDSDVNLKTDFGSVDPNVVLERLAALPISTWSYKAEASDVKHIGPMAQDFMAAFGVGGSDRAIAKVDADGVAFAAIQALNARLQALELRNAELERQLSKLGDGACVREQAP